MTGKPGAGINLLSTKSTKGGAERFNVPIRRMNRCQHILCALYAMRRDLGFNPGILKQKLPIEVLLHHLS